MSTSERLPSIYYDLFAMLEKAITSKNHNQVLELATKIVNNTQKCHDALMDAYWRAQYRNIESILKNGTSPNCTDSTGNTPLMIAINSGSLPMICDLVKYGANVNQPCGENKITPLMYAASFGRPSVVELLLLHGADKNATNLKGERAFDVVNTSGTHSFPDDVEKIKRLLQ